jgi:hypothetical protein
MFKSILQSSIVAAQAQVEALQALPLRKYSFTVSNLENVRSVAGVVWAYESGIPLATHLRGILDSGITGTDDNDGRTAIAEATEAPAPLVVMVGSYNEGNWSDNPVTVSWNEM